MGLTDGINSDYIRATRAFKRKGEIYVYVEDQLDVVFWDVFIRKYKKEYNFVITPVINIIDKSPVCGKTNIFKRIPISSLGTDMWICIDSDYDEIISNYPNSHPESFKCPFVIRTYVYAIENMKCDVTTFYDYILKSTLQSKFDISILNHVYAEISRFLWEIMPIHLASVELHDEVYYQDDLYQDLNEIKYSIKDTNTSFTEKVNKRIKEVEKRFTAYVSAHSEIIAKYEQKLHARCENKPNKACMFMNGHHLFDYTVSVLCEYCHPLYNNRLQEIANSTKKTEREQQRQKYLNETQTTDGLKSRLEGLINDCTSYEQNPFFSKVQDAIDKAMAAGQILNVVLSLELYSKSNL